MELGGGAGRVLAFSGRLALSLIQRQHLNGIMLFHHASFMYAQYHHSKSNRGEDRQRRPPYYLWSCRLDIHTALLFTPIPNPSIHCSSIWCTTLTARHVAITGSFDCLFKSSFRCFLSSPAQSPPRRYTASRACQREALNEPSLSATEDICSSCG